MSLRFPYFKQTGWGVAGLAILLSAGWWLDSMLFPENSAGFRAPQAACHGFVDQEGRPIHPMLVAQFLPALITPQDDNGQPTITSVNVNSTRQSLTMIPVGCNADGVSVSCGKEQRIAFLEMEIGEDESFSYRCLGRTSRGIFVIETLDNRRYSAPGHVWLMFFRLEKSPSIDWRSDKEPPTTHLRLVGFRMPEWSRCVAADCGKEHTHPEANCDRVWTPDTRLVGDRLETRWKWEPNPGSSWEGKPATAAPPVEVFDLSNR